MDVKSKYSRSRPRHFVEFETRREESQGASMIPNSPVAANAFFPSPFPESTMRLINLDGRLRLRVLLLLALLVLTARQAPAEILLSIEPDSPSASVGTKDNFFEVTLTNNNLAPVDILSFNFELSTDNKDILFTRVTTGTTAPYIFQNSFVTSPTPDGLGLPTISATDPGQTIDASDTDLFGGNVTVAPGSTVGLGRVFFDVVSGASTFSFKVSFTDYPGTSLGHLDSSLDPPQSVDIDPANITLKPSDGFIIFQPPAVPEPGAISVMSLLGCLGIAVGWSRLRRPKLPARAT
jgi:hypothetical protein